ncbi:MAG: hypothetical protein WCO61_12745 [Alphaproteobacteria bacterium]
MIRPLMVRVPLAALFASAALSFGVMSAPARAGDLMDAISNMMGGNNVDEDQYQERSPLVVPPSKTLPKPKQKAEAADPAWPKDPDVIKKQKAKKGEDGLEQGELFAKLLGPMTESAAAQQGTPVMAPSDPSKPLSPQEMAKASEIMKQVAAQNNALAEASGPRALTAPPKNISKKAVITPEIEAAAAAANASQKPWYQLW